MAKRTKEEALETRERLLDAALEVFSDRGVSRPSLTDVAELAGATRGAVYGHFCNKADLFTALCDRVLLPMEAVAEMTDVEPEHDPLERLKASWIYVFRDVASNPKVRMLLEIIFQKCEMLEENGVIVQRMQQGRAEAVVHTLKLLDKAVEKGQLPADLDTEAAVILVHAAFIGVLSDWIFRPEFDLSARAESYAQALIDMLTLSPALRRTAG